MQKKTELKKKLFELQRKYCIKRSQKTNKKNRPVVFSLQGAWPVESGVCDWLSMGGLNPANGLSPRWNRGRRGRPVTAVQRLGLDVRGGHEVFFAISSRVCAGHSHLLSRMTGAAWVRVLTHV